MTKLTGWYEMEVSGDGRKFLVTAEIIGSGIEASEARTAIFEASDKFSPICNVNFSRGVKFGDLRKIDDPTIADPDSAPKAKQDRPQVRIWKVKETTLEPR